MTSRRGFLLIAAGLFAVGLTLRPQVVAIGPLTAGIGRGLHVSHAVTGLLATIPVLCMGLLAPPAQMLLARYGSRAGLALCLGLIAVFGSARAVSPPAAAVILLTVPIGIGIALAQAMLPALVKARFAAKPVFATGIYTVGISAGGAISTIAAVPLASVLGGWRGTLLALSIFAGLVIPAWLLLTRRDPPEERRPAAWPSLPLRSRTAWLLVSYFTTVAILYYGLNHWLAESYVERGWRESSAGLLVGVMNLCTVPGTFVVAALADRFGTRRAWLIGVGAMSLLGTVGVVALPDGAWLWVVLIGLANGGMFPLLMTLPLDVAREPREVGAVVAMMLGAGYTLAAASPLVLGAVRDATGSFTDALWALVGVAVLYMTIPVLLTPERLGRGVTAGRSAVARRAPGSGSESG